MRQFPSAYCVNEGRFPFVTLSFTREEHRRFPTYVFLFASCEVVEWPIKT